jgi:hypothetical protein
VEVARINWIKLHSEELHELFLFNKYYASAYIMEAEMSWTFKTYGKKLNVIQRFCREILRNRPF